MKLDIPQSRYDRLTPEFRKRLKQNVRQVEQATDYDKRKVKVSMADQQQILYHPERMINVVNGVKKSIATASNRNDWHNFRTLKKVMKGNSLQGIRNGAKKANRKQPTAGNSPDKNRGSGNTNPNKEIKDGTSGFVDPYQKPKNELTDIDKEYLRVMRAGFITKGQGANVEALKDWVTEGDFDETQDREQQVIDAFQDLDLGHDLQAVYWSLGSP